MDLREKLGSVGWAVTCTRMGYEHLRALSPRPERVNLSYHGLDLTRFPHWQGTRGARDGADGDGASVQRCAEVLLGYWSQVAAAGSGPAATVDPSCCD